MPEFFLRDKTFLVTAGGSGIGLATAQLLVESGANVGVSDVDADSLGVFIDSLEPNARVQVVTGVVDVSERAAVRSFVEKVRAKFNRLDGIASVAGVADRYGAGNVWDAPDNEYDYVMNVNMRGLFNIFGETLKPGIIDRPGSIVHVGSEYSLRGGNGSVLYSAAKHGCLGMVKSAALEAGAGHDGVRINAVLPGPTDTPSRRAALEMVGRDRDTSKLRPVGRPADPKEIAEVIVFLLCEKSSFVTGAAWTVDGGSPI